MSNGRILWQGPSAIDGAPIVVIAVGFKTASTNRKTGDMVQTYILRSDLKPTDAIKQGADESICGTCPHRGDGTGKGRTCYVNVGQGPLVVFKQFAAGKYPVATDADWEALRGRAIRFGTYGDPAAAPFAIFARLKELASITTGYTHQWRRIDPAWAALVMASADTADDATKAHRVGYRTFRVSTDGERMRGEALCPASEEAGRKLLCEQCGACNGANGRRGSIFIPLHGGIAVRANVGRLQARLAVA